MCQAGMVFLFFRLLLFPRERQSAQEFCERQSGVQHELESHQALS